MSSPEPKQGGLLERLMSQGEGKVCRTCANLVKVGETALGCVAHDKLILPNYPPYHGRANCKDWAGAE